MGRLHQLTDWAWQMPGAVAQRLRVLAQPKAYTSMRPLDFFVIGLQKSGSYWLTNLLNRHPEISCFPTTPGAWPEEGHLFDSLANPGVFRDVFRKKHGGFYRDLVGGYGRADFLERLRGRYNAFAEQMRDSKALVGEKTCEYVFHLDLMDQMYPGIKKVCIVRDPRDRVVSFYFHQIRKGRLSQQEPITGAFVEDYIDRVAEEYTNLLEYEQSPLHALQYESLKAEDLDVVCSLLRFLSVESSRELAQRLLRETSFNKLSDQHNPANSLGHFRKGQVADWQNHLSSSHEELLRTRLAPLTERLCRRFGLNEEYYR